MPFFHNSSFVYCAVVHFMLTRLLACVFHSSTFFIFCSFSIFIRLSIVSFCGWRICRWQHEQKFRFHFRIVFVQCASANYWWYASHHHLCPSLSCAVCALEYAVSRQAQNALFQSIRCGLHRVTRPRSQTILNQNIHFNNRINEQEDWPKKNTVNRVALGSEKHYRMMLSPSHRICAQIFFHSLSVDISI